MYNSKNNNEWSQSDGKLTQNNSQISQLGFNLIVYLLLCSYLHRQQGPTPYAPRHPRTPRHLQGVPQAHDLTFEFVVANLLRDTTMIAKALPLSKLPSPLNGSATPTSPLASPS